MTDHDIQLVLMAINSATLVTLIWYAVETTRLRRAAQDQLEALSKPCLTLWADLRDQSDAIISTNQAVGNTVLRTDGANFVVHNIGGGAALNVRYRFRRTGSGGRKIDEAPNYLQAVLAAQKVTLPEPVNAFSDEYEIVFQFESFGGKAYQSVVALNGRVLVGFRFRPLKANARDFH